MKRLIFTLLLVALAATSATALSPYYERLLWQVVASELDFQEILGRQAALAAIPDPTPIQQAVLRSYSEKLDRDRTILRAWIADLKLQGINFAAAATLTTRAAILTEMRALEQAAIDERDIVKTGIQAQIDALKSDGIPDEEQAEELASLANQKMDAVNYILEKENRKTILDALKAGGWTWAEAQ